MDPIAKRFMWEVISRLSTRSGKTAVILTTHSMNEAQALCTRIGIMVKKSFLLIIHPMVFRCFVSTDLMACESRLEES